MRGKEYSERGNDEREQKDAPRVRARRSMRT